MVVLQILGFAYAMLLPGLLVTLHLGDDWTLPLRLGIGLAVGLLTIPLACFSVAWLLGTNIGVPLVLGVGTAANVAAAAAQWLRRRLARPAAGQEAWW